MRPIYYILILGKVLSLLYMEFVAISGFVKSDYLIAGFVYYTGFFYLPLLGVSVFV